MEKRIIYVTGFIGSRRRELARQLAEELGLSYLDLDLEIQARDGRSVQRIARTMGEHEVRNKEYEVLASLDKEAGLVVAVSDGAVLDDQCLELLEAGEVIIADADLSLMELWNLACQDAAPAYAFLLGEDREAGLRKFMELYDVRMPIYRRFLK